MSLVTNIQNAFTSVAAAIKSTRVLLNGNASDNSALNTTAKGSLLAAINEVLQVAQTAQSSGGAQIDDTTPSTTKVYSSSKTNSVASSAASALISDTATDASHVYSAQKTISSIAALIADGATAAGTTWSSSKVTSYVTAQINALLNGAPAALDTLKELADAINDDAAFAATVTTALGNRIRFDAAQTYTAAQITQGQANLVALGMATAASVSTLSTNVGDTTTDFVGAFTSALAS